MIWERIRERYEKSGEDMKVWYNGPNITDVFMFFLECILMFSKVRYFFLHNAY